MSRTYKDVPSKFRFTDRSLDARYERIEYTRNNGETSWYWLPKRGGPKIKKNAPTEHQWYKRTPSWWTRTMMNRPMRAKVRVWERKVSQLIDYENAQNSPDQGCGNNQARKPHVYYY